MFLVALPETMRRYQRFSLGLEIMIWVHVMLRRARTTLTTMKARGRVRSPNGEPNSEVMKLVPTLNAMW